MPTRYLKPGIRDSERINLLSPSAEVLYYRLLVTVDDFGRTDARPAMLKAACFPIRDSATPKACAAWLAELQEAELLEVYEVDGKPYMQMLRWDNIPRATSSKFPSLPEIRAQLHTSVCSPRTVVPLTVTVTETETVPAVPAGGVGFSLLWLAYPRKTAKPNAARAFEKLKPSAELLQSMLSAVRRQAACDQWAKDGGQFIPHLATWLNGRRWEDEVAQVAVNSDAFAGVL